MNRSSLLVCAAALSLSTGFLGWSARAGEAVLSQDEESGWKVYTLRQGLTEVRVVPEVGCNVYSVKVDGVEYFRTPDRLGDVKGGYGNPLLYPSPNRIKGASFRFDGKEYKFPPNSRGNFIHGLVLDALWSCLLYTSPSTRD